MPQLNHHIFYLSFFSTKFEQLEGIANQSSPIFAVVGIHLFGDHVK